MLLYAITDRRLHPAGDLIAQASSIIRGGVDWIQVREKDLPDGALLGALRILGQEARRMGVRLLVNGRPDLALLSGAYGVHLPSSGLPVADVRSAFPAPFMVVRSCHSLADAVRAEQDGADAVVLGPVFETPSKAPYGPPVGPAPLQEACGRLDIPVLAIGGVDEGNAADVRGTGAAGFAAIRLFCSMTNPLLEIPALRERLGK